MHFYAEKILFHVEKISRTFMQRKVPFMQEKVHALSWLVHGISATVFDPMVLVRGIASKSVDLMHFHGWFMVLVRQFLILWFWSVVLHPKVLISRTFIVGSWY